MTADDAREFTAGDVRDVTGLSYRQLNDWESRGLLRSDDQRSQAWRRFSPREIFVLLVLAELRTRFRVPAETLHFVRDFMLQEKADHLKAAVDLMAILGVEVWLMTDFKDHFVMDSELEFADMWTSGYFGGPANAFVFLKVSPLVNKLLATLKEPVHLESHRAGQQILADLRRTLGANTPAEIELLQLIRSGDYRSVEVILTDGTIDRLKTVEHPDPARRLEDLLKSHDYQTITVTSTAGRVVSIRHEKSIKP